MAEDLRLSFSKSGSYLLLRQTPYSKIAAAQRRGVLLRMDYVETGCATALLKVSRNCLQLETSERDSDRESVLALLQSLWDHR